MQPHFIQILVQIFTNFLYFYAGNMRNHVLGILVSFRINLRQTIKS